jgi:hypothetical protein
MVRTPGHQFTPKRAISVGHKRPIPGASCRVSWAGSAAAAAEPAGLDRFGDLSVVEFVLGAIERPRPAGRLLGELGPHLRQRQILRTAIWIGRAPRELETLRRQRPVLEGTVVHACVQRHDLYPGISNIRQTRSATLEKAQANQHFWLKKPSSRMPAVPGYGPPHERRSQAVIATVGSAHDDVQAARAPSRQSVPQRSSERVESGLVLASNTSRRTQRFCDKSH